MEVVCEKKSYKKRSDASKEIAGLSKRYKQKFSAYRCEECGMFHITTINKKTLQPAKATKYPIKVNEIKYRIPKEKKKKLNLNT